MLSITLDPEIERRLSEVAKLTGKTEADYVRGLIAQDIEDLEDLRIAEERFATLGRTFTLDEVRKELGLDD
jgi:RHH-type transcriptional regulator, rel operon repressor / antitoxin RelB